MRTIITGGRKFERTVFLRKTLDDVHEVEPITLLIHGACSGTDLMSEAWAKDRGIPYIGIPAWPRQGGDADPSAGPRRNRKMLELHPKRLIAFPGGRGTADMIGATQAYNKYWSAHPERERFCWITRYVFDGGQIFLGAL